MPRTKQVKSKTNNYDVLNLLKDFQRMQKLRERKTTSETGMGLEGIRNNIDLSLSRIPNEIRKMEIEKFINVDVESESEDESFGSPPSFDKNSRRKIAPPSTVKRNKTSKRVTSASADDGYVTEHSRGTNKRPSRIDNKKVSDKGIRTRSVSKELTEVTKVSRVSRNQIRNQENVEVRRSRSYSRGQRRPNLTSTLSENPIYKTPANSKIKEFTPITPKLKPNTPINILRRPRDGEIAVSMQGSPLMVSAVSADNVANVNIPLSNGDIMSLLPNEGLRLSLLPPLDENTKKQLSILQKNIGAIFAAEQ